MPISNVEVEVIESSKASNKTKVVWWYSAGVIAVECFLARNCQLTNRSSQLEPTKVCWYFIEYHLCFDGIPLTALESYPPLISQSVWGFHSFSTWMPSIHAQQRLINLFAGVLLLLTWVDWPGKHSHWIPAWVNPSQPTCCCSARMGLTWHSLINSHCSLFQAVLHWTPVRWVVWMGC